MTEEQIDALAELFSGPAVADASIRLQISANANESTTMGRLNKLGGKVATQFFAVRRAFRLDTVPHDKEAIARRLRGE